MYSQHMLQICVAKICQVIGFEKTHKSAIDALTSIAENHIKDMCKNAHRYCEHVGRREPTLGDLLLAFKDFNIDIEDLKEYVDNVGEISPPKEVAKYPNKHGDNLNFLRPGSFEVITRPLHIHDHLPPMCHELANESELFIKYPQETIESRVDDCVGLPLREVRSVLMTRSGFLSSPLEGKLPVCRISNSRPPLKAVKNVCKSSNHPISSKRKVKDFVKNTLISKEDHLESPSSSSERILQKRKRKKSSDKNLHQSSSSHHVPPKLKGKELMESILVSKSSYDGVKLTKKKVIRSVKHLNIKSSRHTVFSNPSSTVATPREDLPTPMISNGGNFITKSSSSVVPHLEHNCTPVKSNKFKFAVPSTVASSLESYTSPINGVVNIPRSNCIIIKIPKQKQTSSPGHKFFKSESHVPSTSNSAIKKRTASPKI